MKTALLALLLFFLASFPSDCHGAQPQGSTVTCPKTLVRFTPARAQKLKLA